MVDIKHIRTTIAKGLKDYVQCLVIRGNQTGEMPAFPFIAYNITTPASANKGTYGVYEDGTARKPVTLTMSITAHSDDYEEAVTIANKAREWLDYVGRVYLNDNDVNIQSVGAVTDRSNILTTEYMYSQGFDCFISTFDVIANAEQEGEGQIETVTIGEAKFAQNQTTDELNKRLERRLDGES